MSKLTRSKVAYDLNVSPHKLNVEYPEETITFVFSSALYLDKFKDAQNQHRKKINDSLSNRFGFKIEFNKLSDLKLYTTIEKRGFLLYKGQVKIECLKDITLNGETMTVNG